MDIPPKKPLKILVLDAAVELICTIGAGQLTLDSVAAQAGVSKGGLLHHFKSKEALLLALVRRLVQDFEAEWKTAIRALEKSVSSKVERDVKFITTYVDRSFSGLGVRNRGAMTLLALASREPSLRQPIRDYFKYRTDDIMVDSINPLAMLSIMQLADGLWLFDALGISPFEGALREQLSSAVKTWARQVIETTEAGSATAPAA